MDTNTDCVQSMPSEPTAASTTLTDTLHRDVLVVSASGTTESDKGDAKTMTPLQSSRSGISETRSADAWTNESIPEESKVVVMPEHSSIEPNTGNQRAAAVAIPIRNVPVVISKRSGSVTSGTKPLTKPNFTTERADAETNQSRILQGGSARQLAGLKPIVPLRKRGQSFRETRSITTSVDGEGRRHLNQYTFLDELGRGAYGVVYKVESNETKEIFAAKIVDKKALKRIRVGKFGNALQNVKKELTIWKRFKHRHIVVLREVIDTDDSDMLYMISELVEGGSVLDDKVECTPLSAEQTKTYFCHLIEGIDFLHENKIIHRDIKPGNLLLKKCETGEVILKIADFGVSHEMENDDDSLRQTSGTAIFNAPEMLTGENFHGKPIDVWACGITLYMFVYGHPPFAAKTLSELYGQIQNDPIKYPERVGERVVEKELIDLMQHILEKDPANRYTTRQIRAHPWAWRDFQVSAMKCVTHPEGRQASFSTIPKTLANVASVSKSLRSVFGRPKVVLPVITSRSSLSAFAPAEATEEADTVK